MLCSSSNCFNFLSFFLFFTGGLFLFRMSTIPDKYYIRGEVALQAHRVQNSFNRPPIQVHPLFKFKCSVQVEMLCSSLMPIPVHACSSPNATNLKKKSTPIQVHPLFKFKCSVQVQIVSFCCLFFCFLQVGYFCSG